MRLTKSLAKLDCVTQARIARLRAMAYAAHKSALHPQQDRYTAFVVIELLNLWSNFVRTFLLSCLLEPRGLAGARVLIGNAAINNPGLILWEAKKVAAGPTASPPVDRRDEPAWHEPRVLLRTCQALACSNLLTVQAAMSLGTQVFHHLPTYRNFYAHRNEESASKAIEIARRHYLIVGCRHPTGTLHRPAVRRPQPLIFDWLDDVEIVTNALCQ